ncbi:MAG: hypothetical protein V1899_03735 [Planctomycetota bacterium]
MIKISHYRVALPILAGLSLLALNACTTTAAKKALNRPAPKDTYSGFDKNVGEESKRAAAKPETIKEDLEPEEAVATLVKHLQRERAYAIPAEEQLKWWGAKQGVNKIVVRKVRPLLKDSKIEVRAPALRLVCQFGGTEINGDLIECLADNEYGIRAAAFKALYARAHIDFGYNAAGGEIARAKAVEEWRQWWQIEQRRMTVQPPSVYEFNQPQEPRVTTPGQTEDN